jgi:hypothetical protein
MPDEGRPIDPDPSIVRMLHKRLSTAAVYSVRVGPGGDAVAYIDIESGHPELAITEGMDTRQITDGQLRGHPSFGMDIRWTRAGDGLYVTEVQDDDPARTVVHRCTLDGTWKRLGELDGLPKLVAGTASGPLVFADNVVTGTPARRLCHLHPAGDFYVVSKDHSVQDAPPVPPTDEVVYTGRSRDQNPTDLLVVADSEGREATTYSLSEGMVPTAWHPSGNRLLGRTYDGRVLELTLEGEWIEHDSLEGCEPVGYEGDGTVLVRDPDQQVLRTAAGVDVVRNVRTAHARDGTVATVKEADGRIQLVLNDTVVLDREHKNSDPAGETVSFECPDGEYRDGHLCTPNEDTDRAIVWPYSPIENPYVPDLFAPVRALLVDHGWAVLNPENRGHGGSEDAEADIAAAGRCLRERGYGTLVVLGHSSGATDACLQAVWHSDVWDSAVAWNPITDYLAQDAYEGGRENMFRATLGEPEDNAQRWRELSPISYAEDLGTNLLLIHSANDTRVPIEQSERMATTLEESGHERGTDFSFRVVSDEWHATRSVDSRARRWAAILEYLEQIHS